MLMFVPTLLERSRNSLGACWSPLVTICKSLFRLQSQAGHLWLLLLHFEFATNKVVHFRLSLLIL